MKHFSYTIDHRITKTRTLFQLCDEGAASCIHGLTRDSRELLKVYDEPYSLHLSQIALVKRSGGM